MSTIFLEFIGTIWANISLLFVLTNASYFYTNGTIHLYPLQFLSDEVAFPETAVKIYRLKGSILTFNVFQDTIASFIFFHIPMKRFCPNFSPEFVARNDLREVL